MLDVSRVYLPPTNTQEDYRHYKDSTTTTQLYLAMSATATPIRAELFALAIKDLPSSSLHYKARELRNSIAHLDYSNQQMLPYTDGTNGEPDPDCIDAIKENEAVIERQKERLGLLKVEVEGRGMNWREFMSAEELEAQNGDANTSDTNGDLVDGEGNPVNGYRHTEAHSNGANVTHATNGAGSRATAGSEATSSPWTDGTFVTGTIRGGSMSIDGQAPADQRDPPLQRLVVHRAPLGHTESVHESEEEDGMHL